MRTIRFQLTRCENEFLEIQGDGHKVGDSLIYNATYIALVNSSYLQYSNICARLLRRALKPELQEEALKVEDTNVKIMQWADGKPGKPSKFCNLFMHDSTATITEPIAEHLKQHQTG